MDDVFFISLKSITKQKLLKLSKKSFVDITNKIYNCSAFKFYIRNDFIYL